MRWSVRLFVLGVIVPAVTFVPLERLTDMTEHDCAVFSVCCVVPFFLVALVLRVTSGLPPSNPNL